jgi:8-oxo-dGTP pyrophosphatase MutT (NUDIX family)
MAMSRCDQVDNWRCKAPTTPTSMLWRPSVHSIKSSSFESLRNRNPETTKRPCQEFIKKVSSDKDGIGIILVSRVGNNLKYGLVKRSNGYGMYKILKGTFCDDVCFTEISDDERNMVRNMCEMKPGWENIFQTLWKITMFDPNTSSLQYKFSMANFVKNIDKVKQYLDTTQSIFPNGIWGFPKGKRERYESDMSCALREVREETYLTSSQVSVLPIDMLKETYKAWSYRYFVGKVDNTFAINRSIDNVEISEIVWCSLEDALNLIPSDMVEKKALLRHVDSVAHKYM